MNVINYHYSPILLLLASSCYFVFLISSILNLDGEYTVWYVIDDLTSSASLKICDYYKYNIRFCLYESCEENVKLVVLSYFKTHNYNNASVILTLIGLFRSNWQFQNLLHWCNFRCGVRSFLWSCKQAIFQ